MTQVARTPALSMAAVLVGAVLGYLGARVVLVGSGLSLVPWAIVGMGFGAASGSRRHAAVVGALFGFPLAYVFMISGYDGSAPLRDRLAPFLLLGCVGAAYGAGSALVGHVVRSRLRR